VGFPLLFSKNNSDGLAGYSHHTRADLSFNTTRPTDNKKEVTLHYVNT